MAKWAEFTKSQNVMFGFVRTCKNGMSDTYLIAATFKYLPDKFVYRLHLLDNFKFQFLILVKYKPARKANNCRISVVMVVQLSFCFCADCILL